MKNWDFKVWIIVALILSSILSNIYTAVLDYQNGKKFEKLYQYQDNKLIEWDTKLSIKNDSLNLVINDRNLRIKELEKSLKNSLKIAAKNNVKYEQNKNKALRINDADSLANELTSRYKKRQRKN